MISDERYWSVDLPGLTEADARDIAAKAEEFGVCGPSVVDPKLFLTISMDRSTVVALVAALLSSVHDGTVRSMLEEFEDWLEYSTSGEPQGGA